MYRSEAHLSSSLLLPSLGRGTHPLLSIENPTGWDCRSASDIAVLEPFMANHKPNVVISDYPSYGVYQVVFGCNLCRLNQ